MVIYGGYLRSHHGYGRILMDTNDKLAKHS